MPSRQCLTPIIHCKDSDFPILQRILAHWGGYNANSGGASRFFYCAKTSRADRDAPAALIQKELI